VTHVQSSELVADGVPDLATPEAFTAWVQPHWSAMARLAGRYHQDPDDIVQDALAVAWRMRDRFDPTRGTARSWLLAITADQRHKTWLRASRWGTRTRPLAEVDPAAPPGTDGSAAIDLERALRRLSTRQRLAVDLHYYLGLDVTETAAVMRCSPGTVKSTLSDARGRLRRLLGEDYR
jgi:RNA polymerase sigma-70 factor (ECF subfamily)